MGLPKLETKISIEDFFGGEMVNLVKDKYVVQFACVESLIPLSKIYHRVPLQKNASRQS